MQNISVLFALSAISKAMVLFFTLYLIRVFSVESFALFISIFVYFSIIFQLASGFFERLYIVETIKFECNYWSNILLFIILFVFIPSLLFLYFRGVEFFILIFFLALTSFLFQITRVFYQKHSKFKEYALLEISRNLLWTVSGVVLLYFSSKAPLLILYSYGIFNLLIFAVAFKVLPKKIGKAYASYNYLFSKKTITLMAYAFISGLFPYIVFILVEHTGDLNEISSLGASLRYQAVLSLFVASMGTVFIVTFNSKELNLNDIWKQVFIVSLIGSIIVLIIYFIIPFIDMGKYPSSAYYFILLSITTFLSLLSLPAINFLLKEKYFNLMLFSISTSLVLPVIVGIGLFFIYKYNVMNYIDSLLFLMILAYAISFIIINIIFYRKLNT